MKKLDGILSRSEGDIHFLVQTKTFGMVYEIRMEFEHATKHDRYS